jgi:hypothetical protein
MLFCCASLSKLNSTTYGKFRKHFPFPLGKIFLLYHRSLILTKGEMEMNMLEKWEDADFI